MLFLPSDSVLQPVEKDHFVEVLKNYSESSKEQALKVLSLKESFPYSQLLHTLSARLSKDHGLKDQQRELQMAAVYASDRAVLKDVMTLDRLTVIESISSTKQSEIISPSSAEDSAPPRDSGSLAEEVMHDLETLHQTKHNYEVRFIDTGDTEIIPVKEKKVQQQPIEVRVEDAAHKEPSAKSRKERIIEMAKALDASESIPTEDDKPKINKKKENSRVETSRGENIIEEIVSTKQKIEPENERQKQQLEIIEKFIKTQPSISNSKDKLAVTPVGDLAIIKTGEFNDNVVSETLVEILIKQGKKDKAVEVLKKLIWKFPQKKAYFAAQIDELKK